MVSAACSGSSRRAFANSVVSTAFCCLAGNTYDGRCQRQHRGMGFCPRHKAWHRQDGEGIVCCLVVVGISLRTCPRPGTHSFPPTAVSKMSAHYSWPRAYSRIMADLRNVHPMNPSRRAAWLGELFRIMGSKLSLLKVSSRITMIIKFPILTISISISAKANWRMSSR